MAEVSRDVLKEYSGDKVGARVGWVLVEGSDRNPDILDIHLGAGTVGNSGAQFGVEHIVFGDETESTTLFSESFVACVGLSAYLSRKNGPGPGTYHLRAEELSMRGRNAFAYGGLVEEDTEAKVTERKWAETPAELCDLLRAELAHNGAGQHFASLYYTLNAYLAHEHFRRLHNIEGTPLEQFFVADPGMKKRTRAEIDSANVYRSQLTSEQEEDLLMRQRLTVFSDIPAVRIPEVFVASRQKVAELEKKAKAVVSNMAASQGVYLPVGFRPSGRTWPYMDPEAKTREEQYGRELNGLLGGRPAQADNELNREIDELTKRIDHADKGRFALSQLLAFEERE